MESWCCMLVVECYSEIKSRQHRGSGILSFKTQGMAIFYRSWREDGGSMFCWDWWTCRPTTVWLKRTSTQPSPVYRWVWEVSSEITVPVSWLTLCWCSCSSCWTALWFQSWWCCPGGFWRYDTEPSTMWPSASVCWAWGPWWGPTFWLTETRDPVRLWHLTLHCPRL